MNLSPFKEVGTAGAGRPADSVLPFNRIRTPMTPFGDMPDGGWPAANDPTRADATPDYDGWGIDSWWTANDWMTWHRSLKARYGLDEANRRFITAWEQQDNLSGPISARSFDSDFREYARTNGFLDALYSGLGGLVTRPIGAVTDVTVGVTDVVSNVGQAASTVGGISKYLLPVAAIALGWMYFSNLKPSRR